MINKIEIALKPHITDVRGESVKKEISDYLGIGVSDVRITDVYVIEAEFTPGQIINIAKDPLLDPIIQDYAVNKPINDDFDFIIRVGFRPGVTDNVGKTAKEAIGTFLNKTFGSDEGVYTAQDYLLKGDLTCDDVKTITSELLANELIQNYQIKSHEDFVKEGGFSTIVPKVDAALEIRLDEISLDISDDELLQISIERLLALTLKEMTIIKEYLSDDDVISDRRDAGLCEKITDVELEALAQTWSEHCKHKIFNANINYTDEFGITANIMSLFKTYIVGSTKKIRQQKEENDFCLSVFKDNAGVIRFDDGHNVVLKVETHNSPSALDPYGGALTGIVGVNRDPFGTGMGARLIFNTDVFCFAPPFYEKKLPPKLLHPRRIYEGVVKGVEHGGNKSGIPTVNGTVVFDERYLGKPLVFCGTGGIMPRLVNGKPSHEKEAKAGDLIVMTGGRIGKDGIHGATFSSQELHEGSPVTAVQIGDPITQKKMTDFLLIARDAGLYNSITDNGAGGLSSSVGEMAEDCGGCVLHLDRAPLKYRGLQPWEILVSEAQERMTLAVPKENIETFIELAGKMSVEAAVLGEFTDSGKFHVLYEGRTVAYLDMEFLHAGLPEMNLRAEFKLPNHTKPALTESPDINEIFYNIMASLNVCSKESIVRRYDHEVQGGSVIKPFVGAANDGPSDAAVLRPVLESTKGIVVSNGICPKYSDIDTYHMAACAIDEAVRNAVCVGANIEHMAGLDNFCWCDPVKSEKNPDGEYKLAQLVRANKALYDYCTSYGVPCISGKDSMKNDYIMGDIKISVPPTLLFTVISTINDVRGAVTMDFKSEGDYIYVLGVTKDEMGGSEYYKLLGHVGKNVPKVNADEAFRRYKSVLKAMRKGIIRSCHDASDGGLGVALAESAFAGGLGAKIDLEKVPSENITTDDVMLFSESQSRMIVSIRPEDKNLFENIFTDDIFTDERFADDIFTDESSEDERFALIGTVTKDNNLKIKKLDGNIETIDLVELKSRWQEPLKEL
jgi:phosphoribosylformylglycinamidine synthase